MAIVVKPDLIRPSRADANLTESCIYRIFEVSGLQDVAPESRQIAAMNAPGVPSMLDPYPDPTFKGVVVERSTSDPSYSIMNVIIKYQWKLYPSAYLKTVGGSLRQIEWCNNNKGISMQIPYSADGSISWSKDPNLGGVPSVVVETPAKTMLKQGGIFHRTILSGTVGYRFLEILDPEFFNLNFAGCVNIYPWRDYPARTLMILPMTGSSHDNIWYDNQYTIHYRAETHDEYVFYKDSDGIVPYKVAADVVVDGSRFGGNGWVRIRSNIEVDFYRVFPGIEPGVKNYGMIPPNMNG